MKVLVLLLLGTSVFGIAPSKKIKFKNQCTRDDKEVPSSSTGPRHVNFKETRETGYYSKPELKKIIYLNQDYDQKRNKKMQAALEATLKHTALGNASTIEVERFKTYIPDDLKNKKKGPEIEMKLRKFTQGAAGKFSLQDGADLKVVAIYASHTAVLQEIASKVTNTSEDFKNTYFVLEDDVSFGGHGIKDWADQVMCHISKLPPDWDVYKFGVWGESEARRKETTKAGKFAEGYHCGNSMTYNEHSCALKLLQGESQWEWMGNMGFAIRPRGAAHMLRYLQTKQVMDVDGAMLPTGWSNSKYAPNVYGARMNLVWHKSPTNGRSGFLEKAQTEQSPSKTNILASQLKMHPNEIEMKKHL